MTLKPVNCCMACRSTPRNTARRTFLFALKSCQPACLTLSVSLMSASSSSATSVFSCSMLRTLPASAKRPFVASQRGLSGSVKTVRIRMKPGMAMIESIERHEPE